MNVPNYSIEIIDISGNTVDIIERPVSVVAARNFGTVGNGTLRILPDFPEDIFGFNTRFKIYRTGPDHVRRLFGDTVWFLRKFTNDVSNDEYVIEVSDAMILLAYRAIAYTAQTEYADKTLEEFALADYTDAFRIDNMMRQYVRENYGEDALDPLRNNGYILVEEDRSLAPYGEKQASWAQLDQVLADLARMSAEKGMDLYYDLLPQAEGKFLFKVWSDIRGADRGIGSSDTVEFSDVRNELVEIEVTRDYTGVGSYCYVLGYDTGPAQIIFPVANNDLIRSDPFGRIEFTANSADAEENNVGNDAGLSAINGKRPRRLVSARLAEATAATFMRDFNYGDRVAVQILGRKYDALVSAVSIRWSEDEEDLEVRLNGSESLMNTAQWETYVPPEVSLNTAPIVDAGDDQDVIIGDTATLAATVTDDGLPNPPAALTYLWTKQSGPGTVTFGDATLEDTTADFSAVGVYVLRLSASDGALTSYDEIEIAVSPEPPPGAPDFGLIEGQELVAGIGHDGYVYRTTDFQTPSGSGGPTWDRINLMISNPMSWVVDPFSPGYIDGVGDINGWVVNATNIYRVTDLFGAAAATSVHTFAVPTTSSEQFRTIQASFGAYFDEGDNPWLMVVSYYHDAMSGVNLHHGTWALRSLDGGVTWESETQITHFQKAEGTAPSVPAVYLSPKTPGLAYATAYLNEYHGMGYYSTDWGETWNLLELGLDPANPTPRWTVWYEGGSFSALPPSPYGGAMAFAIEVGSTPGTAGDTLDLGIIPPADTKRVEVDVEWRATRIQEGGSSSTAGGLTARNNAFLTRTGSSNYSSPAPNSGNSGSFSFTVEKTLGGDWPINLTSIQTVTPTNHAELGARLNLTTAANAVGSGNEASMRIIVSATITEIELDDGTIYTPQLLSKIHTGGRLGGDMHVPWQDNDLEDVVYHGWLGVIGARAFRTYRVDGTDIDEISPSTGGREYGWNDYGFTVRAYDSDRQYVVVAGTGNDVTVDGDDEATDYHAIFVSNDFGDTWTTIVAPQVHAGHTFAAAFAGDTEQVLFLWGLTNYISYTSNFGASVDSRAGNLSSIGSPAFLGIAGGPTP